MKMYWILNERDHTANSVDSDKGDITVIDLAVMTQLKLGQAYDGDSRIEFNLFKARHFLVTQV